MKKTVTRILSVILVLTMLLTLASCGEKAKIRSTISDFQKACNELNVEAVVDCLEPTIAGLLNVGAGLLGDLLGSSEEEVFNTLSSLLGDHSDAIGIESFKTLQIKVNDIAEDGATANAKVTLTYVGISGEEKTTDATINLKNSSDQWLISGVTF